MHTGFEGHYTNKASSTREGEATFYRTSRFRLAARQDVILRDCFKDLLHPAAQGSTVADVTAQHAQRSKRAKHHAQFEPMLRSSPHLQHVLQGVATVAQMTLLKPVTQPNATPSPSLSPDQEMLLETSDSSPARAASAEGNICVVNSHFFFHPRASHVRNIHTAAVMTEVEAFIDETLNGAASCSDNTAATAAATAGPTSQRADEPTSAASEPVSSQRPAMLFCGDLNSDLNDGPPGTPVFLDLSHQHCVLQSIAGTYQATAVTVAVAAASAAFAFVDPALTVPVSVSATVAPVTASATLLLLPHCCFCLCHCSFCHFHAAGKCHSFRSVTGMPAGKRKTAFACHCHCCWQMQQLLHHCQCLCLWCSWQTAHGTTYSHRAELLSLSWRDSRKY